jgi:protein tyrosine/serine phosphatase
VTALEGVDNFRDFGGYKAVGGYIRRGILFRSGDLSRATDTDLELLKGLGIGTIVDLRRPIERQYAASRYWDGYAGETITSDVPEDFVDWAVALKEVDVVDSAWFERSSIKSYTEVALSPRYTWLFSKYLRACARSEGAILVHCAAGKDRTGMLCAIVQKMAGVHHADIMTEYLKTNNIERIQERIPRLSRWLETQTGHRVASEVLETALSVRSSYLERCFSSIEEACGSFDRYIEQTLLIDTETRALIEKRLYE